MAMLSAVGGGVSTKSIAGAIRQTDGAATLNSDGTILDFIDDCQKRLAALTQDFEFVGDGHGIWFEQEVEQGLLYRMNDGGFVDAFGFQHAG
jgi:hypothetical protein